MKVDYKKHYSKSGTVYTQTISIDSFYVAYFNRYLRTIYIPLHKREDPNVNLYLQYLSKDEINYLTLTTLKVFKEWLDYNFHFLDKVQNRIKIDRNTIIIIK